MTLSEKIEQRALEIVRAALDDEGYRNRLNRGLVSDDHGWGWHWECRGRCFVMVYVRADSFEFEAGSLAALICAEITL